MRRRPVIKTFIDISRNAIDLRLLLTEPEREHLFMLAFGHPPEVVYCAPEGLTPRLQRVLDLFEFSPVLIKTATWDVLAWNNAAAAVFTDYSLLPASRRNILSLMFCNPGARAKQEDWQSVARFIVSAFPADATRAGASAEVINFADELCSLSPEFSALWRDNDIRLSGEGTKRLRHATHGVIELEYSGFAVDGRSDLSIIVYNPVPIQTVSGQLWRAIWQPQVPGKSDRTRTEAAPGLPSEAGVAGVGRDDRAGHKA